MTGWDSWRSDLAYDYNGDAHRRNWALLERCEAMLRQIQYGGSTLSGCTTDWEEEDACPAYQCGAIPARGERHHEHCPLAALLADLRKELGK